jgi:4-diphosphocytidyl-2C-methyl-D-erythritol kinase
VPDFQVSTPLIYKRWDSFSAEKNKKPSLTEEENNVKILCLKLKKKDLRLIKEGLFNSLEDVTLRFYPQVKKAKEALSNIGLEAILMSGSGPAVFGVVASRKEAMEAKRRLEREGEFHQVFVVSTI